MALCYKVLLLHCIDKGHSTNIELFVTGIELGHLSLLTFEMFFIFVISVWQ